MLAVKNSMEKNRGKRRWSFILSMNWILLLRVTLSIWGRERAEDLKGNKTVIAKR